jgi:uncharacterized membrane protein YhhN
MPTLVPGPTGGRRALHASLVAALASQALLFLLPLLPWAVVLRPLPLLVLAAWVARAVPLRRSWPVALGLALGGAGDVAMTLRHGSASSAPLLAGMFLFAFGHAGYCIAFFRERALRPRRALGAALFAGLALAASALLLPHLGPLAAPAGAYALALTTMTALAVLRRSPRSTVLVGAGLFFASDLLIAARLAMPAVPLPVVALILPTYYLGQYAIAVGWARDAAATSEAGR